MTLNGYDDWFLPSKDELYLIYSNLKGKGVANLKSQYYWASTDAGYVDPYYYAYMVSLGSGSSQKGGKDIGLYVWAVRAF